MSKTVKYIVYIFITLLITYIGNRIYGYYFDTTYPTIEIVGIEKNNVYSGDVSSLIYFSDGYRIKFITISLDNKDLIDHLAINSKSICYPLNIPTNNLENGPHEINIKAVDSSKNQHQTEVNIPFYVDNMPLEVYTIKKNHALEVKQGNTLKIYFQSNKKIKKAYINTLGVTIPFIQETPRSFIYEAFIPISVEEIPNEYVGLIEIEDFVGNRAKIDILYTITEGSFKSETIGLSNKKFEDEEGKSEKEYSELLIKLSLESPIEKNWHGSFYLPCDSKRITTEFGVIRTSKERGKYRHNAIDLAAQPKSSVWATQDGKVIIKDKFVHTGNVIVLDHGCGIVSIYAHLDSFADIELGSIIKKGKLLGKIGMTGYATGYHLHWEIRINNIAINPMEWI